ncbi:MAG: hypothetical protein AAF533_28745 [Acidobacteriota bacterium]
MIAPTQVVTPTEVPVPNPRRASFRCLLVLALASLACGPPPASPPPEPAVESPPPVRDHFKYVAVDGAIHVHDMNDRHRHVKTLHVPELKKPRGIAAHAGTARLYLPFWGDRGRKLGRRVGYVLCYDLVRERVAWLRDYEPSIDSLEVTPDGTTLYMPSGEERDEGDWLVIDAATGDVVERIPVHAGAHNTIMSPGGERVYMTCIKSNQMYVGDTRTNEVIRTIGPFGSGIRPFAINRAETLAVVNVDFLSGFEVADLVSGKVLHRVQVEGYPWVDPKLPRTQSHGVTMTPDEREVWVVDDHNRHVHVFDITGLPEQAPVQVASIDVKVRRKPKISPKWINVSRDGRLVHVSTGAIIDRATRKILTRVAQSRYFVEIVFENGRPVEAFSRYGNGHGAPPPASATTTGE